MFGQNRYWTKLIKFPVGILGTSCVGLQQREAASDFSAKKIVRISDISSEYSECLITMKTSKIKKTWKWICSLSHFVYQTVFSSGLVKKKGQRMGLCHNFLGPRPSSLIVTSINSDKVSFLDPSSLLRFSFLHTVLTLFSMPDLISYGMLKDQFSAGKTKSPYPF